MATHASTLGSESASEEETTQVRKPRLSLLVRTIKRLGSLASLIALVLGLWIKWDQSRIEERQKELDDRIKTEHLTGEFADKMFGHLNELGISEAKQREGIVIDLLDLVTQAHMSESGNPEEMLDRQRSLPLRLALIAGNDESLADMGGAPARYKIWISYAKQSGNAAVRATALRALGNLCRANVARPPAVVVAAGPVASNPIGPGTDPLIDYLDDLRVLSNDLSAESPPIREAAIATLPIILRAMAADPLRYRGNKVLEDARTALASVIGRAASHGADNVLAGAKIGDKDRAFLIEATAALKSMTDSGLVRDPAVAVGPPPEVAAPDPAKPAPVPVPAKATPLDDLVDSLEKQPRAGRANAAMNLNRFTQQAQLTGPTRAQVMVDALGDPDPATRKYVAEFLMRTHDRQTVNAVWRAMKPVLEQPEPGNRLYNAAVVCSTWTRVLPGDLDELRGKMGDALRDLRKKLGNEPRYRRTAILLDELGDKG